MSLLQGANTAQNAEKQADRLGGFQLLESDVHLMTIELAYMQTAASGAKAVIFGFKGDTGTLRSSQWFCSGDAKGNKTFFVKDDKEYNLPGYDIVDNICTAAGLTDGINGSVLEEKVIKLYDKDAGGEVPTKVQMVTNLLNKEVALGVIKQIVDKTALGGDNQYHPTGETREENEITKVFTTDGLTIPEVEAGITEPTFLVAWKDKYQGQVLNKAKGAANSGTAGAPAPKEKKKLFK